MKELRQLADLIKQRNSVQEEIANFTDRPAQIGYVGQIIAATIFRIELESSSSKKSCDGVFKDGPLKGKTVNIKWSSRQEYLLDITSKSMPDYFLVMTGTESVSKADKKVRPWLIKSVYLFEAKELFKLLSKKGVAIGQATSVKKRYWKDAEIYPAQRSTTLLLTEKRKEMLSLFA